MTKERPSDRKRKKNIKIFSTLIVLVLIILSSIFYSNFIQKQTVNEDVFFLTDKGDIPKGDFTSYGTYINDPIELTPLDFVTGTSSKLAPITYKKLYDAPGTYYKPKDYTVIMGAKCSEGDLIRFVICDGIDKSTCKTDMFTLLWQVQKPGNYLYSNKYYIDNLELRWSYSCYQALATYTPVEENSYLDGLKCVKGSQASSSAVDYETEQLCLNELQKKLTQQQQEQQLQEQIANERLDCLNNGGSYSETTRDCTYPKQSTTPTCTQVMTTAYNPNTNDCTTFSSPCYVPDGWQKINSCDELVQEDKTTTNTDTTTTDTTTTNTDTTTGKTVTCKAYESYQDGKGCRFSFKKFVTDQGINDYYNENPAMVVIGIIVIIGIIFVIFTNLIKRKK